MDKKLYFVVFGITSNLAQKKLIPALYDLYQRKAVESNLEIVGIYRQERSKEELKEMVSESIGIEDKEFESMFDFVQGDLGDEKLYIELKKKVKKPKSDAVYYLSTFPELYSTILEKISKNGLAIEDKGFVRLVIEKPLGDDYESSVALNQLLNKCFAESQIYRIDHYLGKETYQNVLAFRFGNDFLKNSINSDNVDHVQITVAETDDVENRIGFYDKVGALKDVGQNHTLQLLTALAMEKPARFNNEEVTGSRLKVINSLIPVSESLVKGQYENYSGANKNQNTFFALKAVIGSGDLAGTSVYIRSGKKMKKAITEVCVVFKNTSPVANVLIYRIKPEEGIIFKVAVKKPGYGMNLQTGTLKFCMEQGEWKNLSAYEKLFVDVINGDPTFFNDGIEVEGLWKFIDNYTKMDKCVVRYEAGSWGPKEADEMIAKDGRKWLVPEDNYCGR